MVDPGNKWPMKNVPPLYCNLWKEEKCSHRKYLRCNVAVPKQQHLLQPSPCSTPNWQTDHAIEEFSQSTPNDGRRSLWYVRIIGQMDKTHRQEGSLWPHEKTLLTSKSNLRPQSVFVWTARVWVTVKEGGNCNHRGKKASLPVFITSELIPCSRICVTFLSNQTLFSVCFQASDTNFTLLIQLRFPPPLGSDSECSHAEGGGWRRWQLQLFSAAKQTSKHELTGTMMPWPTVRYQLAPFAKTQT